MTDAPFPPLIINCRGSAADALQARRAQLGMCLADLDHRSGVQPGYSGKLLRPFTPQGRVGVHFRQPSERLPNGDVVLSGASEFITEALGLRLVMVDAATAEAIGAKPAQRSADPRVRGSASLHHHDRRQGRSRRMPVGQFEAMHSAKVSRDLFAVSVRDHPFIAEDAVLREEAAAIEALLVDLHRRIAAAD